MQRNKTFEYLIVVEEIVVRGRIGGAVGLVALLLIAVFVL
jgi:hypothetical protein